MRVDQLAAVIDAATTWLATDPSDMVANTVFSQALVLNKIVEDTNDIMAYNCTGEDDFTVEVRIGVRGLTCSIDVENCTITWK